MSKIANIRARQVFDSRGIPTIESEIFLDNNISASAIVPSGASTGTHEAFELRDVEDKEFLGKSVFKAVEKVNKEISKNLKGCSITEQKKIDKLLIDLDGTKQKKRLGANTILSVSLAACKAFAKFKKIPLYKSFGNGNTLPIPMMNIINGGSHSDAPIAFQEFMIRPVGANSFSDALRYGAEIFHTLKSIIKEKNLSTAVGDEGGFAPNFLGGTEEAIETILNSIEKAGFISGKDITLAMDCAASEFFKDGLYDYRLFEGKKGDVRNSHEQVEYLKSLVDNYPIDSIEDGCDENDWEGWGLLTDSIGDRCQLVGDDLLVTNLKYLQRAIKEKSANSILIKPNQIGTLTETIDAINLAKDSGWTAVVSHRSGETEDTTISDIAVGLNVGQIKTGSLSRSDRIAKYNQLLRIEEDLGDKAKFPSK